MTEKELLCKLRQAKIARDNAKKQLEEAQHKYDMLEQDMIEHLEDQGATATAKYEDIGYAMIPKPRLYASCRAENQEALFEYLKREKREDLIRTTVSPQSLSSFVKELIEDGKEVPETISYYLKQGIKIY